MARIDIGSFYSKEMEVFKTGFLDDPQEPVTLRVAYEAATGKWFLLSTKCFYTAIIEESVDFQPCLNLFNCIVNNSKEWKVTNKKF